MVRELTGRSYVVDINVLFGVMMRFQDNGGSYMYILYKTDIVSV